MSDIENTIHWYAFKVFFNKVFELDERMRAGGVKTAYCEHLCAIRKCAAEKGVATCGACPDMANCPTLGAVTEHNPSALENLKASD